MRLYNIFKATSAIILTKTNLKSPKPNNYPKTARAFFPDRSIFDYF